MGARSVLMTRGCGCEATHLFELLHIIGRVGHRQGNAVCNIDDLHILARIPGKLGERLLQSIFGGFKESGVIKEDAELVDLRRAFTNFRLRTSDILAVLATSGV